MICMDIRIPLLCAAWAAADGFSIRGMGAARQDGGPAFLYDKKPCFRAFLKGLFGLSPPPIWR